jgi:hypothetical protein
MTHTTSLKSHPAATRLEAQCRAILGIVDHLMNTESVLATAIGALDTDGVDPEDVQIALVIVRERLRDATERVLALKE